MPFAVLFCGCVLLATTSLLNGAQVSETRDLPPVKLAANELDAILNETHAFVDAADGPARQDSSREIVKVRVRGHDIEIPHFSLASNLAFPNEIFAFSYTYYQADKPISSVSIDLGDSSRSVSVTGESLEKVGELSSLLENDFRRYSTAIGGAKFRRVAGVLLLITLLMSLMVSSAFWWNTRRYNEVGMLICSALTLLLLLLVPCNRYLPGLCSLPELFAFLSSQKCGSNFFPQPCRDSFGDSRVVPSSAMATGSLITRCKHMSAVFARRRVCLIFLQWPSS